MKCNIIFWVCKPFFDAHSDNAKEMRGAAATRKYYQEAATGSFLLVCFAATQALLDLNVLESMGFWSTSLLHPQALRIQESMSKMQWPSLP